MLSKKITFVSAAAVLVQQAEATKLQNKNKFIDFPDFPHFGNMMGMGSLDPFGNDFGFGGFNNIEKEMHNMQEQMSHPMIGGNTQSQSFSKSMSSEMGKDGQMHTKQQQSGQKTECHDGHCKVLDCADGKCQEKEEEVSPEAMKQQSNKLAHSSPFGSNFGSSFGGFGNIENSIENSMHQMHANMAKAEHQMQDAFSHIGEMPKIDGNGEVQEQSFQSSSSSEMGSDGKMHTKEVKSGDKIQCHNGKCKQIKCENGKCQEREIDASHQQDPQQPEANRSGFNNPNGASMVKQNKSQAPKGDDGEDLVPMSEGPMQNSKPGDHRDAFKKIIKEMMNPNKQQSGGGGQPHIIEIDPSTPEGEEQLKEIMKMMKDPRHQIKPVGADGQPMDTIDQQRLEKQGDRSHNGLPKSGVKMIGSDSANEGVATGSGRNYNPNSKPSAHQNKQMGQNAESDQNENHPKAEWAPKGKLLFQMFYPY